MQGHASKSTGTNTAVNSRSHRSATYQKARDARKRPIRGLWVRNGRFYAQLTIEDSSTGKKAVRRVPLIDSKTQEPVQTTAQAVAEMERLKTQRTDNALPILKRTPKFSEYVAGYFEYYGQVKDAKRPATIVKEKGSLRRWAEHFGDIRLDKIRRAHVNALIAKRQGAGMAARTVNLDVIALRNVLKRAIEDDWIRSLPTENLRPLKVNNTKRELVSPTEIDRLCAAALDVNEDGTPVTKNGQEFADYIRLMAYCGSRRSETLRLKWSDVDWRQKQLTIGADGLAKNHEVRVADFNAHLETHLKAMAGRRAPDSQWLFPSPQRGARDVSAKTFMESLRRVRAKAAMPKFGFHDCRHFFISMCVMSGVDYMTIARWVGHKDGGVLIGKVYGHLSNEHAQRQAQKVVLGPMVQRGSLRQRSSMRRKASCVV